MHIDIYDRNRDGGFEEKTKNSENDGEPNLSYMSYMSDSNVTEEEEFLKGFQFKPGGRIYEVTDERYKELKGEGEI